MMAHEKLFHVGVKAALITNASEKVLLLKTIPLPNAEPHWDIPGGRIQEGQDSETTLHREVQEETGISVISPPVFYAAVISNIQIPVAAIGKVGLLLMVYTVTVQEAVKITLSPEHTAYEWTGATETAER
jgi:8-oxo-dGTP pyrophosphatase MutT (NUDIX family)